MPPIPDLLGRIRLQRQEPLGHGEGLAPLLPPPVDRLEVPEHAREELALGHRREVLFLKGDGAAEHARDQLLCAVRRQDRAAVERVEEHLLPADLHAHDEVRGEPDPVDLEPEPPRLPPTGPAGAAHAREWPLCCLRTNLTIPPSVLIRADEVI